MLDWRCPICHEHRNHGGNAKLAREHSKLAQKAFEAEKARLKTLNGLPAEKDKVCHPYYTAFTKTRAKIFV